MRRASRPARLASIALVAGATGVATLVAAAPAEAATFSVTTTADEACGSPSNGLTSLREALCAAELGAGLDVVSLPAGTYSLTQGELSVTDTGGVTISGAGAGSTTIRQTTADRVINVDPNLSGGVSLALDGVTVRDGSASDFGGGGIISGSGSSQTPPDSLTLTNSVVTANVANIVDSSATNTPGGGIQVIGGDLTIQNSTVSNNSSGSSLGGGVYYQAVAPGDALTVTGSTFSGNSVANTGSSFAGGAGLAVAAPNASYVSSITGSTFSGNSATSTNRDVRGGAILSSSGTLNIARSTFLNNAATSTSAAGQGGAVYVGGGALSLQFSRVVGNQANTGGGSGLHVSAGTVDASQSWWGCNAGPGNSGCDSVVGPATVSPRRFVTVTTTPSSVAAGATSQISASIVKDSNGAAASLADLSAFIGLAATVQNPTLGSLSGVDTSIGALGTWGATFTGGAVGGNGGAAVTLDNASVDAPVTVIAPVPPSVTTNPTDQTVGEGQTATFSAAADGTPTPTVQWQVSTDGGATFNDLSGATSTTLSFTASAGQDGNQYRAVFSNVADTATTLAATLTVQTAPVVTQDPSDQTVTDGTTASFSAAASGRPTPTVQWQLSTDGGATFANITGENSPTLTFTAQAADDANQYRAVFTNNRGSATTSAATLTVSLAVGPQTISWDLGGAPPSSAVYGDSFSVAATATSGLPVTITTSGPCTISAGQVTITGVGSDCVVRANQGGNGQYLPAPELSGNVQTEQRATTVTVTPPAVQYSDVLPNLTGNSSASNLVPGDTLSGTLACTVPGLSLGVGNTVQSPAGSYPLSCSGLSDPNYVVSYSGSLTVTKEDATVGYTGPLFIPAASASATSAAISLSAFVGQQADGFPGDITNAKVDFLLFRASNMQMTTPDCQLLNVSVQANGTTVPASLTCPLDTYTVYVDVSPANGFFTAPRSVAQTLTTFAPVSGRWTTGGGWIRDPDPGVDPQRNRGNFGFSVRYKRGTTTPQGQSLFSWRGTDGNDYFVKASSWNGGGASFGTTTAGFSGKACVVVVNPRTGLVVAGKGGGNYRFRVDVTDGAKGGKSDSYAISVYTPRGALYHRSGTAAAQLPLGGGNITVHS